MGNPLKIEIKDYQSLKQVNLELVEGINIITGKTNQGKSAVIRAIDAALFNTGDDSMIRGGKRYLGVSIDNGNHKMVFCRDGLGKNEKTAYQFDNNPIQKKVGRSQLPEVAQMFNIRDVRMQNNTKMKLNFWYQNDKPFLMDKTSGQLYEFLSLSSCDKYTKVLKKMSVDMKVQEADINNITTEIDTLKLINNKKSDFISKNEGFDDLYVKVMTADQTEKKLSDILKILTRVSELSNKISKCRNSLVNVTEKYNNIPIETITSKYEDVSNIIEKTRDVSILVKGINASDTKIYSVKGELVKSTSEGDKANKVFELSKTRLDSIVSNRDKYVDISNKFENCLKVKSCVDSTRDKYSILCEKSVADISDISEKIDNIVSKSDKLNIIYLILSRVDKSDKSVISKREQVSLSLSKLEKSEREFEQLKQDSGYCPFCGTVFNGEHNHN